MLKKLIFLIALIILLATLLFSSVLFTNQGLVFLANLGTRISNGALHIKGIEGSIAGGFKIGHLAWNGSGLFLESFDISCRLELKRLIYGEGVISQIDAQKVILTINRLPEKSQETDVKVFQIPALPLSIHLKDLSVKELVVNEEDDKRPLVVRWIKLKGSLVNDSINIEQIKALFPAVRTFVAVKATLKNLSDTIAVRCQGVAKTSFGKTKRLDSNIKINGDLKRLRLWARSEIRGFNGSLNLTGTFWQDSRFDVKAEIKKVDPGIFFSRSHGLISGTITADGILKSEKGPLVKIHLGKFHGKIDDYTPLKLKGNILVNGQRIETNGLVLESANSTLFIRGFKDKSYQQIDITFASTDLSDIWPGLQGKTSLTAHVEGKPKAPSIKVSVSGKKVAIDKFFVKKFYLTLRSNNIFSSQTNAKIFASGLRAHGLLLGNLDGRLQGNAKGHTIRVNMFGGDILLELLELGSLSMDNDLVYEGILKKFSIGLDKGKKEKWILKRPSKILIGKKGIFIDSFCLFDPLRKNSRFCLKYREKDRFLSLSLKGEKIPVDYLSPFLSSKVAVKGEVDLHVEFVKTPNERKGKAFLKTDNASISFEKASQKGYPFVLVARANLLENVLTANIDGQILKKIAISGTVSLPKFLAGKNKSSHQPVKAHFEIDAKDLDILHQMVPGLYIYSGNATAFIDVSGSQKEPHINGLALLSHIDMEYPEYGLKITSQKIELKIRDDLLILQGKLDSKSGILTVKGQGRVRPSDFKLTLEVMGKDYQAVSMPQLEVKTSPELQVIIQKDRLDMSGTVFIPFARIHQVEIPETAILPSPDIKIKGEGREREKRPLKTDITLDIIIGKDVRVDAYGLKGRLEGRLKITSTNDDQLLATGILSIKEGTYSALDVELHIKKGRLSFFASPIDNPSIEVEAVRKVEDTLVGFKITGTLKRPVVELFSDPSMPESEIARYLLGGKKGRGVAKTDIIAGGVNLLISRLRQRLGLLNELKVETGQTSDDISLVVGTYLRPDLYLKFINDFDDKVTRLILRYEYSRHIEFETETGESPSAEVFFKLER